MYKGDKFIDIDTIHNLSEKYHKTESELKYLSYPSAHKKVMEIVYCYIKEQVNGCHNCRRDFKNEEK